MSVQKKIILSINGVSEWVQQSVFINPVDHHEPHF